MSLYCPVSLSDVHSELSCILYAARQEFSDIGGMPDIKIDYNEHTYLNLCVGIWGSAEQKKRLTDIVIIRLERGIIWGDYDYRFGIISRNSFFDDSYEPHWVTAQLDLSHWPHRKPHGWDPSRPHIDPLKSKCRDIGLNQS